MNPQNQPPDAINFVWLILVMMPHNHSHDVNFGMPPGPPKMMCAIHTHANLYSILYAPPTAILNLPCLLLLNQLDSSLDYIFHLHYRTETGVKSPGVFKTVVSTVARDYTFIIVARFHMEEEKNTLDVGMACLKVCKQGI